MIRETLPTVQPEAAENKKYLQKKLLALKDIFESVFDSFTLPATESGMAPLSE